MPKVVYTPGKGLFQQAGTGIQLQTTPYATVQTQNVSSGTITLPGVYTISGSSTLGVLETVMPAAASFPGGVFVFRSLSIDAHYLTGSAEASGTKVFKGVITGSELQAQGSKLTLAAGVGNSVALLSDGKNYLVMANSGSLTIAGA